MDTLQACPLDHTVVSLARCLDTAVAQGAGATVTGVMSLATHHVESCNYHSSTRSNNCVQPLGTEYSTRPEGPWEY
eukprot:14452890-Ditylum_brightwellii.AAC.1